MKKAILNTLCVLLFVLLFMAFAVILQSCSSTRVVTKVRTEYVHDTLRVQNWRVDSVYVAKYMREKGDTIWLTDTIIKYQFKDREKVQRVEVLKVDSVPYEVQVTQYVRRRNWYDRATSGAFWVLFVFLILRIAWWAVKKYYLHR